MLTENYTQLHLIQAQESDIFALSDGGAWIKVPFTRGPWSEEDDQGKTPLTTAILTGCDNLGLCLLSGQRFPLDDDTLFIAIEK